MQTMLRLRGYRPIRDTCYTQFFSYKSLKKAIQGGMASENEQHYSQCVFAMQIAFAASRIRSANRRAKSFHNILNLTFVDLVFGVFVIIHANEEHIALIMFKSLWIIFLFNLADGGIGVFVPFEFDDHRGNIAIGARDEDDIGKAFTGGIFANDGIIFSRGIHGTMF